MCALIEKQYGDLAEAPRDLTERRFVNRALRDWTALGRGGSLPSINHLKPREFDIAWDKSFILRLPDDDALPEFEHCGSTLQRMERETADRRRRRRDTQTIRSLLDYASMALALAVEHRAPVISSGTDGWGEGKMIKFRSILLPFSDYRGSLRYLVGGIGHIVVSRPIGAASLEIENVIFDRNSTGLPGGGVARPCS